MSILEVQAKQYRVDQKDSFSGCAQLKKRGSEGTEMFPHFLVIYLLHKNVSSILSPKFIQRE